MSWLSIKNIDPRLRATLVAVGCLIAMLIAVSSGSRMAAGGGLVRISPIKPPRTSYRERWAVIIGIDTYSDDSVAPLHFAVNDAKALFEVLVDEFSFPREHIVLLLEEDAKRSQIERAFKEWLPARGIAEEDAVLVFFAGHGFIAADGMEGYLAASDIRADDAAAKSIKVSWLKNQLMSEKIPALHKLIILDSCYSGALFQRAGDNQARIRAAVGQQATATASIGDNLAWYFLEPAFMGISAGRYTPVSDGTLEAGHSVFTATLLSVMRERADSRRPDHAFTFRELAAQVEVRVRSAIGSRQIPDWGAVGGSGGDFVFIPDPKRRRLTPSEQAAVIRTEAFAENALTQDPGLALAWVREAVRLRRAISAADFFTARAAIERGVGWEVEQGIRPVVAFPSGKAWTNKRLAVGAENRLRLLDLARGTQTALPTGGVDFLSVNDLAFFPDGTALAAVDANRLRIWNLPADGGPIGPPITLSIPPHFGLQTLAISPSGHRVAVGAGDGKIYVTDAPWTVVRKLPSPRAISTVTKLAFSPVSDDILVGLDSIMLLRVFDLGRSEPTLSQQFQAFDFSFLPDTGALYYICGSPDDCAGNTRSVNAARMVRRLAPYAKVDSRIIMDDNPRLLTLLDPTVALTADKEGDILLGIGLDRIERWGPQNMGQPGGGFVQRVATHTGTIRSLTRAQEWIVSAGDQGLVKAYNVNDAATRELMGHAASIRRVIASSDGQWLASTDTAGSVRLWSSEFGRTIRRRDPVRGVFDVDGTDTILTGSRGRPALWRRWWETEPVPLSAPEHVVASCLFGQAAVWLDGQGIHGPYGDLTHLGGVRYDGAFGVLVGSAGSQLLACAANTIVGGRDDALTVWSAHGGGPQELSRREGLTAIATSSDRHSIAALWSDGSCEIWSGPPWQRTMGPVIMGVTIPSSLAVAGPHSLYVGQPTGLVYRRTPTTEVALLWVSDHSPITSLSVSPDERLLAAGTSTGTVHLAWLPGCETRAIAARSGGPGCEKSVLWASDAGAVRQLRFSTDGRTLVSAADDRITVWPLPPVERTALERWLDERASFRIVDQKAEQVQVVPFSRIDNTGVW